VPVDRFFGVESQARKVVEQTLGKNQLALALNEPVRKPVFLVGQIGDQSVTLHGERGRLVIQTPEGVVQEESYQNPGSAPAAPQPSGMEESVESRGEGVSSTGLQGWLALRGPASAPIAHEIDSGGIEQAEGRSPSSSTPPTGKEKGPLALHPPGRGNDPGRAYVG
jgi:hypothetical protein